jgi:hypothetical protein
MAYGAILKHLEVDKITWGGGSFSKKKNFLKEGLMAFSAGKRGGRPFFNWCGEHWCTHQSVMAFAMPCSMKSTIENSPQYWKPGYFHRLLNAVASMDMLHLNHVTKTEKEISQIHELFRFSVSEMTS